MNQRVVVPFLIVMNLVLVGVCLMGFYQGDKKENIAFVNTAKVLEQYMGMKETQSAYQAKIAQKQALLDTMQAKVEEEIRTYQQSYNAFTSKERQSRESALTLQKDNFLKHKETLEKEVTMEGDKLTQGMLNQINTYIEGYAKEHGYLIIHGSSTSGSILYADSKIDITEQVIEGLNAQYKK